MNKLAQDYTTVLQVNPKIKNSLSAAIYSDAADNTLYLQMKASGFFILGKKFSKPQNITIDLRDMPERQLSTLHLSTNSIREKISDNFDKNIQILSVYPDTIYYAVSGNVSKRVPVQADFTLSFKEEYRQIEPVIFSPDSVTVTGSEGDLDKITSVHLLSKKYDNVDKTVEDISNVVINEGVSVIPQKVRYKIPVERCTEGSLQIPVKKMNVPNGSTLILLPVNVNIRYTVPIKDYKNVTENDFSVEVNFKDTEKSLNRLVKVNLTHSPANVFDVKVEPSFVEFLIQK